MPYPPKYKARGRAPCRRQSLCCFTRECASTEAAGDSCVWWSTRCLQSSSHWTDITVTCMQQVQQSRHPLTGDPACTQVQSFKCMQSWVCTCTCGCLHMQIQAQWHPCAQVLSNVHVHTVALYLHVLGRVPFSQSLSLFSSLNGKRLSAFSFCQQLGDTFLQLAAICFNYVY